MTPAVLLWGWPGFILGAGGALVISRLAGRLGLIDSPNHRSSHSMPTPIGGGVGLLAAFLLSGQVAGISPAFWIPLGALSLFSFLEDRIEVPPKFRLPVQVILVGILVIAAWQPGPMGGFPSVMLFILWTVYLVGTANIYNFMDGINGMAGIAGACGLALLGWFIYSLEGTSPFFYLTVGVALACLGFLPFNVPAARVFMGDIGSIFLGGLFGSLVYIRSRTLVAFLCMISFLFHFYADALTSMVVRLKNSENLTQPHRRHLYQILANEGGISHWKISVAYGLFQILVGVSVMGVKHLGLTVVLTALIFWFILFLVTDRLVRKKF